MRYWVQFLQPSAIDATVLIHALGSDGVSVLDGRMSAESMRREAMKRAQRLEHVRKFAAFRICRGPRLFDEQRCGPVHSLAYPVHI